MSWKDHKVLYNQYEIRISTFINIIIFYVHFVFPWTALCEPYFLNHVNEFFNHLQQIDMIFTQLFLKQSWEQKKEPSFFPNLTHVGHCKWASFLHSIEAQAGFSDIAVKIRYVSLENKKIFLLFSSCRYSNYRKKNN